MVPNSRGKAFIGVSISLTVLDAVFVFARLYTRQHITRKIGLDDWLILFSWFISVFVSALFSTEVFLGLGHHDDEVSLHNVMKIMKVFYINILFYNVSLSATKMSLAVQYLRISPTRTMRIACYILMGIIASYFIMTFLTSAFVCTPVKLFWDFAVSGHCLDLSALWYCHSTLNIATDIIIYILPIRSLMAMQLRKDQKRWLIGLFGLGGLVVLVSLLRLYSLHVSLNSKDKAWANLPAGVWSDLELRIALICASMPAILPLLRHLFPNAFSSIGLECDISTIEVSNAATVNSSDDGKLVAQQVEQARNGT